MVVAAVSLAPTYDTLTQQGKPGDVAVGGIDVVAHLPHFDGFGSYLTHLFPFIQQNNNHTYSDNKCDYISKYNFYLQSSFKFHYFIFT